jgi:hypothetical protein
MGTQMLSRRLMMVGAFALSAASRAAEAATSELATLAQALDAAADAIIKLASGIGQMIAAGDHAYSVVNARVTHDHLRDIDAKLGNLVEGSQRSLLDEIDNYIASAKAGRVLGSDWNAVLVAVHSVIQEIADLLGELKADHSDFVLEDARLTLIDALTEKVGVLSRLTLRGPPHTTQDLGELKSVRERLAKLRDVTRQAIRQMSRYISNH